LAEGIGTKHTGRFQPVAHSICRSLDEEVCSHVSHFFEKAQSQTKLPEALAAIFCVSLYSLAFPYDVPLFFPLTVVLFFWFGLVRRQLMVSINLGICLFVVCLLFFLLGVIHSGFIYHETQGELQNIAGVLLLTPLLFRLRTRSDFYRFRNTTQVTGSLLSATIAATGLYKFKLMTDGVNIDMFWVESRPYPWGSSLVVDYNFFAFALLIGALSALFCLNRSESLREKSIHVVCFSLCSVAMALAGSRRGWVLETVLFLALLFVLLFASLRLLLRLRQGFSVSRRAVKAFVWIVLAMVVGFGAGIYKSRGPLLDNAVMQEQIRLLTFRFSTLADPDQAFEERSARWRYTTELLANYTPAELLFGQGFGYLQQFASAFQTRADGEDYPHNPILSAALYSGVVGAFWPVLFLVVAALEYYKYRHVDWFFFIVYLFSLWFVLVSFNTLFTAKFFPLLLLMPWVVKSVADSVPYEARFAVGT
jgi:hypothetical protein